METKRLFQTIGLAIRKSSLTRGKYLKDKQIMSFVGDNVRFQPRLIPLYPELIKIHDNVVIVADVRLITHDAVHRVLNNLGLGKFPEKVGCIEIGNNVFIGYHSTILPNVKIGNNVIVGSNSVVSKDLQDNGVYVGVPAKKISGFDSFVKSRLLVSNSDDYPYATISHNQNIKKEEIKNAWEIFYKERVK